MQKTSEETDYELLFKTLYSKYQSVQLTRKQLKETLNTSLSTIDRMRDKGLGPKWRKNNDGGIYYPLTEVVRFVLQDLVETA